jgi:hypothetical protein
VCRRGGPGRVEAGDLEELTGLPLAATVPADRRLAAAVERGEGPAVGRRAALGRLGDALAAVVVTRADGAAPPAPPTVPGAVPAATGRARRVALHGGAGAA